MAGTRVLVLPEINTTQDLDRFCEQVRAEAASAADAYGNLSASLGRRWSTLAIPQNGRFAGNPVRRTTKHLDYMAVCAEQLAKGAVMLRTSYYRNIYEPMHSTRVAQFKV